MKISAVQELMADEILAKCDAINHPEYKRVAEAAQAASIAYRTAQSDYRGGVVSEKELSKARAAYNAATASLEAAARKYSRRDASIAPSGGTIGSSPVTSGRTDGKMKDVKQGLEEDLATVRKQLERAISSRDAETIREYREEIENLKRQIEKLS